MVGILPYQLVIAGFLNHQRYHLPYHKENIMTRWFFQPFFFDPLIFRSVNLWPWCASAITRNLILGGGFSYFLFSPLLEKMIQFDPDFSNGLVQPLPRDVPHHQKPHSLPAGPSWASDKPRWLWALPWSCASTLWRWIRRPRKFGRHGREFRING